MKVALVHEWLESYAGSERVLEQLIALFPEADLYALVDFMSPQARTMLGGRPVRTSFIQKLPFARKWFRNYLGLMPIAIEQFSMSGYDLIISSSHAVAKGVITGPNQIHISYVHSPMRYAWDLQGEYLAQNGLRRGPKALYARWLLHRLRIWDVRTSQGVDVFVANSSYIARRIRKVYRRDAVVVHPPVDVERFVLGQRPRETYLIAARMVPYKRVDLVVEAFRSLPDRRLLVIGSGPEEAKIRALAEGAANITILPPQPQDILIEKLQSARAFVYAGEEDFGIGLVEAQACGTPLIAFGAGGACDIVESEPLTVSTGVLFAEQTTAAIVSAIDGFEALEPTMTPTACRTNALRFSSARFAREFRDVVTASLDNRETTAAAGSASWMPGARAEPLLAVDQLARV